jgi:hypothetical protein
MQLSNRVEFFILFEFLILNTSIQAGNWVSNIASVTASVVAVTGIAISGFTISRVASI